MLRGSIPTEPPRRQLLYLLPEINIAVTSAGNLPPSRDKHSRDLKWTVTNELTFL